MELSDLFGSEFTLMGAALAGLALTSLAILRDLRLSPPASVAPLAAPDATPYSGA
jgi:hypothetical protein